ncbi:STAS-like domain-containing protein [Sphaerotilaceae bacterium SBD11-9]
MVEIDFAGVSLTPSFADEFVGGIAASLGSSEFLARIKLSNVSEDSKSLIRYVMARGFARAGRRTA